MAKQISVHNHKCKTLCEHADVCYYVHSKHKEQVTDIAKQIESVISNISGDKQVYYSGCNLKQSHDTYVQNIYSNECERQMTLSINIYKQLKPLVPYDYWPKFNENIQLTVYDFETIIDPNYYDCQKMFLIKNDNTFKLAIDIFKSKSDKINKIHFPVEHSWAKDNKHKLMTLVSNWNQCSNKTLSLDSCLENYLLHKTCVYKDNYIDLRCDGTVRRCPFSDECQNINYDNPDEMFDIPFTPSCIYKELFGE